MAGRRARLGALATAFLFNIGKFLISWYLGSRRIGSVFRAAGSLVLLWVYYSAQLLLFGAEMTRVSARRYGSRAPGSVSPDPSAGTSREPSPELSTE